MIKPVLYLEPGKIVHKITRFGSSGYWIMWRREGSLWEGDIVHTTDPVFYVRHMRLYSELVNGSYRTEWRPWSYYDRFIRFEESPTGLKCGKVWYEDHIFKTEDWTIIDAVENCECEE